MASRTSTCHGNPWDHADRGLLIAVLDASRVADVARYDSPLQELFPQLELAHWKRIRQRKLWSQVTSADLCSS